MKLIRISSRSLVIVGAIGLGGCGGLIDQRESELTNNRPQAGAVRVSSNWYCQADERGKWICGDLSYAPPGDDDPAPQYASGKEWVPEEPAQKNAGEQGAEAELLAAGAAAKASEAEIEPQTELEPEDEVVPEPEVGPEPEAVLESEV